MPEQLRKAFGIQKAGAETEGLKGGKGGKGGEGDKAVEGKAEPTDAELES